MASLLVLVLGGGIHDGGFLSSRLTEGATMGGGFLLVIDGSYWLPSWAESDDGGALLATGDDFLPSTACGGTGRDGGRWRED